MAIFCVVNQKQPNSSQSIQQKVDQKIDDQVLCLKDVVDKLYFRDLIQMSH